MYHIHWMTSRDLPAVLEVERASFELPWPEKWFRLCLRQNNCIGLVAEDLRDTAVGFAIYELYPRRIDLLNLAVHPARRRTGVGAALIDRLKYKLVSHRRTQLVARVRDSNLAAQLFFRAHGFRAIRVIRGPYTDTIDDAYELVYRPTAEEWDRVGGEPVNRIAQFEEPHP